MKRALAVALAVLALFCARPSLAQYANADTTTMFGKLNFPPTGTTGAGFVRRDTTRSMYIEGAAKWRFLMVADSAVTCSTITYQVSLNDTDWVASGSAADILLSDGVSTSALNQPRLAVLSPADGGLSIHTMVIAWRFVRAIVIWKTTTNYNHAMRAYGSVYKLWQRR